jgi:hypothetical protein
MTGKAMVTVTQTFTVDGEVAKQQTFPITGLRAVEEIGCPPIKIEGFGQGEVSVTFTFDPPLLVPGATQPDSAASSNQGEGR